jgi:hypothetical protein
MRRPVPGQDILLSMRAWFGLLAVLSLALACEARATVFENVVIRDDILLVEL